jgi:hypothetical protein
MQFTNQVKAHAQDCSSTFFTEWQVPFDPAATDWDSGAWDALDCLSEIEELEPENIDQYYQLFSELLESGTLAAYQSYRSSFEIEEDGLSIVVIDWCEVEIAAEADGDTVTQQYPIMKAVQTIEVEEIELSDGSVDALFSEELSSDQSVAKLPELPSNLKYAFSEWQSVSDGQANCEIVATITIVRRSLQEALAYQVAKDCGLQVVAA